MSSHICYTVTKNRNLLVVTSVIDENMTFKIYQIIIGKFPEKSIQHFFKERTQGKIIKYVHGIK